MRMARLGCGHTHSCTRTEGSTADATESMTIGAVGPVVPGVRKPRASVCPNSRSAVGGPSPSRSTRVDRAHSTHPTPRHSTKSCKGLRHRNRRRGERVESWRQAAHRKPLPERQQGRHGGDLCQRTVRSPLIRANQLMLSRKRTVANFRDRPNSRRSGRERIFYNADLSA